MELALLQLNAQIMEVQLVAIVLLGKIFSRYKSKNSKMFLLVHLLPYFYPDLYQDFFLFVKVYPFKTFL